MDDGLAGDRHVNLILVPLHKKPKFLLLGHQVFGHLLKLLVEGKLLQVESLLGVLVFALVHGLVD